MLEGGANIPHIDTGSTVALECEIKVRLASERGSSCYRLKQYYIVLCTCILNGLYVRNKLCEEVCIYWSAFPSVWFVRRGAYVSEESLVA
jgi:hypothetical protein